MRLSRLTISKRWMEFPKEHVSAYKAMNSIAYNTNGKFSKKLGNFFGIKIEPSNPENYYQESRSKNGKIKKGGYRAKTGGKWYSATAGTFLHGRKMDLERLWMLGLASLYVANQKNPNATRMASLSGLTRSNAYNLIEVMLERKTALEKTDLSAAFMNGSPLERSLKLIQSLFKINPELKKITKK